MKVQSKTQRKSSTIPSEFDNDLINENIRLQKQIAQLQLQTDRETGVDFAKMKIFKMICHYQQRELNQQQFMKKSLSELATILEDSINGTDGTGGE